MAEEWKIYEVDWVLAGEYSGCDRTIQVGRSPDEAIMRAKQYSKEIGKDYDATEIEVSGFRISVAPLEQKASE